MGGAFIEWPISVKMVNKGEKPVENVEKLSTVLHRGMVDNFIQ
jgi:hypothetical protein